MKNAMLPFLFLFFASLPAHASQVERPQTSPNIQNWVVKLAKKYTEKRHERLERKLAKADSPEKIARIKKKQSAEDVAAVFLVIAGLCGLVGLGFLIFGNKDMAQGFFGLACLFLPIAGAFAGVYVSCPSCH